MTDTKHTDSVEAAEKEYQRQLAISIKIGEANPHISAFIGAWNKYDDMMNDCPMTSKDRAQMRKMLTTLQATQKPQTTDSVEVSEIAKQINNGLAMMLTPSNEAMQACRWVKAEVERAITTLQAITSQQVEEAVRKAISLYDLEISPLLDTRLYPLLDKAKQRTLQQVIPPNHQD